MAEPTQVLVPRAVFGQSSSGVLQAIAHPLTVATDEGTCVPTQKQRTLEERPHTVIANTPVILFAVDSQGIVTLVEGKGPQASRILPVEFVGRSFHSLSSRLPGLADVVQAALNGEPRTATVEVGDLVLDVWSSPLRDGSGELTGMLGTMTARTEQRHLERQMVHQERLATVGQLAGGIAHDFNNFLTTIILYANLIARHGSLPEDLKPAVETIIEESHRAADLVGQILDFSRRSAMEVQVVNLPRFLEEVTSILRRTLPENVEIVTDIETDLATVSADPTRIQQLIMNLAINARDAMPEGGTLQIALSTAEVRPDVCPPQPGIAMGNWACLTISDTGTGMTEEVFAHLFEPFFTTKGARGTGLGLTQVHSIVKQHGGHIGVESEVGQGTTFRIYLPMSRMGAHVSRAPLREVSGTQPGSGEKILLVEDEVAIREAGCRALTALGYQVITAANGQEALALFQRKNTDEHRDKAPGSTNGHKVADLVITDMVMPDMGGKALVRKLLELDPELCVLGITGYVAEELDELHAAGFMDVVQKPLDIAVLTTAIRRLLDRPCKRAVAQPCSD